MILSASTSIGWLHPFPIWVWLLLSGGCIGIAWWTYRRFDIPIWSRWILGGIRALVLLVILVYLSGPVIERSTEDRITDKVVVLIDRSGSMETTDVVETSGSLVSRNSQLKTILEDQDVWESILRNRSIDWFGFHEHPFPIDDPTEPGSFTTSTDRFGTDIITSIDQVDLDGSINPIAGFIILSDGRMEPVSIQETTSSLRSMGIPVFSIPIGSGSGGMDVGIESTKSPDFAYVGDTVPIIVDISNNTGTGSWDGELILRDSDSGEELDRLSIEPDQTRYTLIGESSNEGDARWIVELDQSVPDLVSANNTSQLMVEMVDEPLRVLYIEGYPRWEYRYLKNLLMRETSITSSILLLSADKDYAQEGDRPITRLPATRQEFDEFDVVIVGDVPASSISGEQQRIMEESILDGDLGIIWIGGPRWTPSDWNGGAIANTIPFDAPIPPETTGSPVHMVPTYEANQMGILRIDDGSDSTWPPELGDASIPWSAFQWSQSIDDESLKPTTEILANTIESTGDPNGGSPLLLGMRYGAGRSIYSATDEFWRWRHGRGERLYEQFWIQIIRSLARSGRDPDEPVRIQVAPSRVQVGRPQYVRLIIDDASLVDQLDEILTLRAGSGSGSGPVRELVLNRDQGRTDTWSTTWTPDIAGRWMLTPTHPSLVDAVSKETIVDDASGEMTNPATDHRLLERIALETSGELVDPDDISRLPELVPDRSITTINTRQETIWNRWWLFVVPILLLGLEWIGRRAFRLA